MLRHEDEARQPQSSLLLEAGDWFEGVSMLADHHPEVRTLKRK
jgi:hypothetical protein